MRLGLGRKSFTCVILACLFQFSAPAAESFGAAAIRFVHAVPGAGTGELRVSAGGVERRVGGRIGFGQISDYAPVGSGAVKLEVSRADGRRLARAAQQLADGGRYTAVLFTRDSGATLRVYRDSRARSGGARLRILQAAPELGKVDVRLDGQLVAKGIGFRDATSYRSVEPGGYELTVRKAGGGGAALASRPGLTLTAGAASTAFLVGSRGEPVRVAFATDATVAPPHAPETGLGGLAGGGGPDWALAALIGLIAGSLGGGAYLLAAGPRRRRRSGGG
jgi:uncharacterized protein DUF4397